MSEPNDFENFLRRVATLVFWLLLLVPVIIFPIAFFGSLFIPKQILEFLFHSSEPNILFVLINKAQNPFLAITEVNDFLGLGPCVPAFSYIPPPNCSPTFFRIVVFPGFTFVALITLWLGWYERKLVAKIHMRYGPLYAGRISGVLQPIADLLKLLFKEIIVPAKADKPFFVAVPLLTMGISAALLAVIPLSERVFIIPPESASLGLLVLFAILGFYPIIILMGAWASSNKFSFIGGLRALHQLVSYEIPWFLSVLGVVVLTSSLDPFQVVRAQSNIWFIVPQFIGAFVFLTAAMAELERIPFDLPEADTEIVFGWLTEYTGMNWGILFGLAPFIKLYVFSGLFTLLFLGGWLGFASLPPEIWFLLKTFIVINVIMLVRVFNPRIRVDLLIRFGWVYLILLAVANLFLAVALKALGVF